MRAPYGLNILDNCMTCPVREEHLFCNLAPSALQKLNDIKSTAVYPKSAVLFIEGQQPRGVFVLCTGKVKLSTSSSEGKTLITKLSSPGDVLGLNAAISNHAYEVTAEMIEPGQANFIPRDALLQFLKDHGEVALTRGSAPWDLPVLLEKSLQSYCSPGIPKTGRRTGKHRSN
jgi:CRP/FNR family transcriptional regulator, cyclic AMP receptor protein